MARDEWQIAIDLDPGCCAYSWGLAIYCETMGRTADACRCHDAVMTGDWSTAKPKWIGPPFPWHANPSVSATYLARHRTEFEALNPPDHIREIVLHDDGHADRLWLEAMRNSLRAGCLGEAERIAMNGLCDGNWHDDQMSGECLKALIEVYEERQLMSRAEHLKELLQTLPGQDTSGE